MVTTMPLEY